MQAYGLVSRARMDALVDGVMAITMTRLVLELRLPELASRDLWNAVAGLEMKFISWILSFLILALCWQGQARAFRHLHGVDSPLFWLVAFWLMLSSLIPFTSALIGEHNEFVGSHILCAANVIGAVMLASWRNSYINRHAELFQAGVSQKVESGRAGLIAVAACAAASIRLTFFAAPYASIPYAAMFSFSIIQGRHRRHWG